MAERADVVIIGAGFAGAATAYHLVRSGTSNVVVLEAEARAGAHASGRNAALAFQCLRDREHARLAIEGTEVYGNPPEDLGGASFLDRTGSILLASADGEAALEREARAAAELGLPARLLDGREIARRVPVARRGSYALGLESPTDGVVAIDRLLRAYLDSARAGGARIGFGETVRAVVERSGRVTAVETESGRIETRVVVNAAGAWAGRVARLAGLPDPGFEPRRRHLYEMESPSGIDPRGPFVWHDEIDVYYRPIPGGVLASPCDETPHEPGDPPLDPDAEERLREKLHEAFPALATARVSARRACLRTFAPEGRFWIEAERDLDGFVWAAGLGGHGMSTSHGVGRLAAAAVSRSLE